jgi:hypothetical protein
VSQATQNEDVAELLPTLPQSTPDTGSSNGGIKRLFRSLGPGLITGASDDDPSGIATYSQAGAQFGFSITWTLLFTYPLMAVIQEISARIGRTTGCGVAANIARHYPNWILQTIVGLLLFANVVNIGADLGAMGDAVQLLVGGPRAFYVLAFGCLRAVVQVFVTYARYVVEKTCGALSAALAYRDSNSYTRADLAIRRTTLGRVPRAQLPARTRRRLGEPCVSARQLSVTVDSPARSVLKAFA